MAEGAEGGVEGGDIRAKVGEDDAMIDVIWRCPQAIKEDLVVGEAQGILPEGLEPRTLRRCLGQEYALLHITFLIFS